MLPIRTCEFVNPAHPDKMCDIIADSLLDNFLTQDPKSRVALEVSGGRKLIVVNGEVTTSARLDIPQIVSSVVGEGFDIRVNLSKQSPFIAQGVDHGGAGDQGIMVGYACRETEEKMPKDYILSRELCRKVTESYPLVGKVQVTLSGESVSHVVASFQNSKSVELESLVREFIKADNYLINPAGEWTLGGFDADSGVSGRKLVVDSYGPGVPIGGGSFSGKDYTKVDRSGAYMARKVAVDLLTKHSASAVLVRLAYAIGISEPVMAVATLDNKLEDLRGLYDFRPIAFPEILELHSVNFTEVSKWGHFGREFPWDKPF